MNCQNVWNFQQGVPNLGEQDRLFLLVKKSCMSHLQLSMQMTTMEKKHLLSFTNFLVDYTLGKSQSVLYGRFHFEEYVK